MEGPAMRQASASVKRDLRQEVTDNIIAALEKGVAPWQRPWQSGAFEMPMNPTSGKPYRGGNAIHLMMVGMRKGYEDPRWLTYRQAQETNGKCDGAKKAHRLNFGSSPMLGPRSARNPRTTLRTPGVIVCSTASTPSSTPVSSMGFRLTCRACPRSGKLF